MKGKWSCYRVGQCREGEWLCYRISQFNGLRMIMLQRWTVLLRENGHVTEVVSLMEGEWLLQRLSP